MAITPQEQAIKIIRDNISLFDLLEKLYVLENPHAITNLDWAYRRLPQFIAAEQPGITNSFWEEKAHNSLNWHSFVFQEARSAGTPRYLLMPSPMVKWDSELTHDYARPLLARVKHFFTLAGIKTGFESKAELASIWVDMTEWTLNPKNARLMVKLLKEELKIPAKMKASPANLRPVIYAYDLMLMAKRHTAKEMVEQAKKITEARFIHIATKNRLMAPTAMPEFAGVGKQISAIFKPFC